MQILLEIFTYNIIKPLDGSIRETLLIITEPILRTRNAVCSATQM